jgi:carboxypeptidase Taq
MIIVSLLIKLYIMFTFTRSVRRIGAFSAAATACTTVNLNTPIFQQSLCASSSSSTSIDASAAKVKENYSLLEKKLNDIEFLGGVSGLLGWDEMVMLAPGSSEARNKQKSVVASLMHKMQTDPELGSLLDRLNCSDLSQLPSDFERANVRDARRDFLITTRKTEAMATAEAELEGKGYQAWAAARKADKYADFAPVLAEIVQLQREIGLATRPEMNAYDGK